MMKGDNRSRILLADDDAKAASVIRASLESAGFEVLGATTAEEAFAKVRELKPALVIFDTRIPGMAGMDFLRTLRSTPETSRLPVVAISGNSGEIDRIVALELGADDYITKPFSTRELALRVKAILSRCPVLPRQAERFGIGRFVLDPSAREVLLDGVPITVSALDFRILSVLIREEGRVVSRERLIELAWGADSEVSLRTVDTQLRRLRVKLGPAARQVRTVRGFGYRLGE